MTRRELQQLFGIDGDCVGLHRRRSCHGCRDDFALRLQALHTRVDQSFPELVEIEKADEKGEQATQVEQDDAARQGRAETRLKGGQPAVQPGLYLGPVRLVPFVPLDGTLAFAVCLNAHAFARSRSPGYASLNL